MSSWRDELEVGDKVILRGDPLENSSVSKVGWLTKTQIFIGAGSTKYRRANGIPIGEHSRYNKILCQYSDSLTEDIKEARKRCRLIACLREFGWEGKSTEALERIYRSLV